MQVPAIVEDVHRLGPTSLPDLLQRYSLRAVKAAVSEGWLREHPLHLVPLYALGNAGRALVGITNRKVRKSSGVMDAFTLRHVIGWHLGHGYTFVRMQEVHVALLLTPGGRREYICAKFTDYTTGALKALYYRNVRELAVGPSPLIVMARGKQVEQAIERHQLLFAASRDFHVTLKGESPDLVRMLTEVHAQRRK